MNSVLGRLASADAIRQIWATIKFCHSSNAASTTSTLVNQLTQSCGWSIEEAELKIQHCLQAGVIHKKIESSIGQEIICLPEEAPEQQPEHDWYCFECHGEGNVIPCKSCFRVYHPTCLTATGIMEKPNGFTCLPCLASAKAPIADRKTVFNQLDLLLTWIVSKAGSTFDLLPDDSVDMTEEQAQWLVSHHMDLNTIRNKLNRGVYATARQFGVDFELLVHDVILIFGEDSSPGQLIQETWKDIKAEVEAFENGLAGPITNRTEYGDGMKVKRRDDSLENKKRKKLGDQSLDQAGDLLRASIPKDFGNNTRPSFSSAVEASAGSSTSTGCGCDVKYKQLIVELQQHWINEYKHDREKVMADLTERMHRDFNIEQEKLRNEMLNQFKQELEATKKDLDQRYAQQLKQEIQKLLEKHKKQISETKKKQWCWQCEAEAIYHCCWNTAYCSVECQQAHWSQHRKNCRRKKQQQS